MRHLVVAISLFSQGRQLLDLAILVTCLATKFFKRDIPACPTGFNNCGFFGCLQTACPTGSIISLNIDCVKITSQEECTKTRVNAVGCAWYEGSCHRGKKTNSSNYLDVVCVQNVDLSCSDGCHLCDGFGCIPENEGCPASNGAGLSDV